MNAAPAHATPDVALAERLFDALRQRTGDGVGITRASYGLGEHVAHQMVRREAEVLGLEIATDAAGNLYMTCPGAAPGPATFIGSHLDSVPVGGNYDGAAGVLMGLSVLSGYRRANVRPARDVTLMAIRAEESNWFGASYIGSRAAFGRLRADELNGLRRNDDQVTLGAAIAAAGGDPARLAGGEAYLDAGDVGVFIEPHIEQGPSLVAAGKPVGIVTGIRGSFRYREAACHGAYAHSGATPRPARQDAVRAVAALITALDDVWSALEDGGHDLTITFGQVTTDPREHAFSKVAGLVRFSLDVRSEAPETLLHVQAELGRLIAEIERDHRIRFDLGLLTDSAPATMHPNVIAALENASVATQTDAVRMPCGAGHDAAVFAQMGVPTGMLFIRNDNGSHNPDEHMDIRDFAAAAQVLSHFCLAPPECAGRADAASKPSTG